MLGSWKVTTEEGTKEGPRVPDVARERKRRSVGAVSMAGSRRVRVCVVECVEASLKTGLRLEAWRGLGERGGGGGRKMGRGKDRNRGNRGGTEMVERRR